MNTQPIPGQEISANNDPLSHRNRERRTGEIYLDAAILSGFGIKPGDNLQSIPAAQQASAGLQPDVYEQPVEPVSPTIHAQYIEALETEPQVAPQSYAPERPDVSTASIPFYPEQQLQTTNEPNGDEQARMRRVREAQANAAAANEQIAAQARELNEHKKEYRR